jgi:hypothetical protein
MNPREKTSSGSGEYVNDINAAPARKNIEVVTLEGFSGDSWGDKLSFTVGTSFIACTAG